MKKKLILGLLVFVTLFTITGCSSSSNGKPADAIDSAVGKVKTIYGDYYLKENLGEFVKQFDLDIVGFGSTNSIDFKKLDEVRTHTYTTANVYASARNPETKVADNVIKFDIRGENTETLAKDYMIESFNIQTGTIVIKNKDIKIGTTTAEDVIKIFGEENLKRKNKSLELYEFELEGYTWNSYWVYFNKNVVTNIVISNK